MDKYDRLAEQLRRNVFLKRAITNARHRIFNSREWDARRPEIVGLSDVRERNPVLFASVQMVCEETFDTLTRDFGGDPNPRMTMVGHRGDVRHYTNLPPTDWTAEMMRSSGMPDTVILASVTKILLGVLMMPYDTSEVASFQAFADRYRGVVL